MDGASSERTTPGLAREVHVASAGLPRKRRAAPRAMGAILISVVLGITACEKNGSSPPTSGQSGGVAPSGSGERMPLPEFYGFYALDQGKLIDFQADDRHKDFTPGVSFIVFQKGVAFEERTKGQLSRLDVDPALQLGDLGDWNNWTKYPVPYRVKPIPGNPEMVQLVAAEACRPGLYALKGEGHFFSVAIDRYVDELLAASRSALAGKRWDEAKLAAKKALAARPTNSSAKRLLDQISQELGKIDHEDKLAKARTAIDARDFDSAFDLADVLLTKYPSDARAKELKEQAWAGIASNPRYIGKFYGPIKTFKTEHGITALTVSHNGKLLAVGASKTRSGLPNELYVVDLASGNTITTLIESTRKLGKAAFSPDDKLLATVFEKTEVGETVAVWDTATWSEATLPGQNGQVFFAPDGTLYSVVRTRWGFVGGYGLRAWDTKTREAGSTFDFTSTGCTDLRDLVDGRIMVFGNCNGQLGLLDKESKELRTVKGVDVRAFGRWALSNNGKWFAAEGSGSTVVLVEDIGSKCLIHTGIRTRMEVRAMACHPTHSIVAIGGRAIYVGGRERIEFIDLDVAVNKYSTVSKAEGNVVHFLTYADTGQLVSGDSDGVVTLWGLRRP